MDGFTKRHSQKADEAMQHATRATCNAHDHQIASYWPPTRSILWHPAVLGFCGSCIRKKLNKMFGFLVLPLVDFVIRF